MAKAELTEIMDVKLGDLFDTITRYEDYPQFVTGCRKVEVERPAAGQAKVKYHVSMMKDLWYLLEHHEDRAAGTLTWKLIQSDTLTANQGKWTLKELSPGKTSVTYSIDIEFNVPVPGFILSKLVKGSLPSMMKSFADQTRKRLKGAS